MSEHDEAKNYLDKVKIALMKDSSNAFFMNIIFGLKTEFNVAKSGGMLGTDGIYVYINPDYFIDRTIEGAKADLLHEAMHVCLGHIGYAKKHNLDHIKHNTAADYYINIQLKDSGTEIDDTFLFDRKYRGKSIKEIYDSLPDEPPEDYVPDIQEGDELTEEEMAGKEMEIKNLISRAVVQAQMSNAYGSIPSELQRHIEELLEPTLPWTTLLANYFSAYAKEDYSYRKPNRRTIDDTVRMPGLYSESMGELNVYIDTSGSIDDETFKMFLGEIQGIVDTLHPSTTNIFQWGSTMTKATSLSPDDKLLDEVELKMLGGTEIELPLRNIKKTSPEVSVVFTDGFFDIPVCIPDTPVLWVILNNSDFTVDFGEVIHLD